MNQMLFERSTGNLGPNVFARLQSTQLLRAFGPAPQFRFDGGEQTSLLEAIDQDGALEGQANASVWAHQAGVTAMAIDRFDGKVLVSGGLDATIKLWDLEQSSNPTASCLFRPTGHVARAAGPSGPGHRFAITHLSFYPFDKAAFLSSSFDQTLKLWGTETARLSGTFELGAKVYTHCSSPIASHLLVACGTQAPAVRLVDLRSSSAVQSLISPGQTGGAAGANLAVAWSPTHEHVLASGAVDGAVRLWDIRRASSLLGLLDQEDSLGIVQRAGAVGLPNALGGLRERGIRVSAKAHTGAVNGLVWTDDGAYLVSAGHDQKIRVWDCATGANTLTNFGPSIRNRQLSSLAMSTSPVGLTGPKQDLLFFPNEIELLVLDLHEGSIVTRLRGTGPGTAVVKGRQGAERTARNRVTGIAWRGSGGGGASSGVAMGGSNAPGGVYSGHLDGRIRAWVPQLEGEVEDEHELSREATEVRKRKRKVLDDAFRELTGKKITFT